MAMKNYYLILGVSRNESQEGIRAAYRDLAKRRHPDLAGAESTAAFQEIVEAYEVLSDPDRRSRYNSQLTASENPPRVRSVAFRPSLDEMFHRFAADLAGYRTPEPSGAAIDLDIALTPSEAHHGVETRARVPLAEACPHCGGTGDQWPLPCPFCDGAGMVRAYRTVWLRIPPRVRHGTILELPVLGAGLPSPLRIRVIIAPH
jgi:molecular chaperone DnaJ